MLCKWHGDMVVVGQYLLILLFFGRLDKREAWEGSAQSCLRIITWREIARLSLKREGICQLLVTNWPNESNLQLSLWNRVSFAKIAEVTWSIFISITNFPYSSPFQEYFRISRAHSIGTTVTGVCCRRFSWYRTWFVRQRSAIWAIATRGDGSWSWAWRCGVGRRCWALLWTAGDGSWHSGLSWESGRRLTAQSRLR